MLKPLARILLALAVASSTLATLGAGEALAAYTGTCYVVGNNYHAYADKASISFNHAEGSVAYLRLLKQCDGMMVVVGTSEALPVNLQLDQSLIAQLGWTQGIFETANHFRYTNSDSNGGMLATSTAFPAPVVGHSYTFIVFAASCAGSLGWTYEIKDLTLGVTYATCGSRSITSMTELWSGFEVFNSNDQFGGAGTDINISDINYLSGSTPVYITTLTISQTGGTQQSYWVRSLSHDPDGHTIVHGRTTNH